MRRKFESDIPKGALKTIQNGTLQYRYKGIPCLKNPFDLALYLQLLYELAPRTIIEIGSAAGGSALWFADTLRRYGIDGHVYSVDVTPVRNVEDDMVTFLRADAHRLGHVFTDAFMASIGRPLLVVEDSAHTFDATYAVLMFFDRYGHAGEYVVVEDGIVNDLPDPIYRKYENGPNRAIIAFLDKENGRYDVDTRYCDFFGHNFTYCTNGYLRRL